MKVLSFILKKFVVLLFVSLISIQLCNGGGISACNFSKNFERKTNTKVDVTSKKSIDDKANNNSMKLANNVKVKSSSDLISVTYSRQSDSTKGENSIIGMNGKNYTGTVYSAKYDFKEVYNVIEENIVQRTEDTTQETLGIVFNNETKSVWVGQLAGTKFIEVDNELFLCVHGLFSYITFSPSVIEKRTTDVLDMSNEILDKFIAENCVSDNFMFVGELVCNWMDYFENPNFYAGEQLTDVNKITAENGLLRFDIGLRPEILNRLNPGGSSFDYNSDIARISGLCAPDGSLWIDLKKEVVVKVEDRTNYPPRLEKERFERKNNN
jgi:hypothetical protein